MVETETAETLSIGELAERAGVATSTLRYYDRIGLVPPGVRQNGRRRYHVDALRRLEIVKACQQAGFSLEEIAALLQAGSGWQALAHRKRAELGVRIEELQRAQQLLDAALACGCADLETCTAHTS